RAHSMPATAYGLQQAQHGTEPVGRASGRPPGHSRPAVRPASESTSSDRFITCFSTQFMFMSEFQLNSKSSPVQYIRMLESCLGFIVQCIHDLMPVFPGQVSDSSRNLCVYHSVNVSCYVIFLCLIMSNFSNIQMPPRRDPDHQEVPQATVVAQFRDYHPEKFSGQGDPRIVDEWVQGLEMIFEVMDCPDYYRVLCAQIQLTGDVCLWRNAYWGMRPGEKEGCTWVKFKELIREKYYPTYYRAEMERQFLALKQDNHIVDEYEREFTRLGAFVPDLVSTEAKRSRRFTDGLFPVVRHNILGHGVQSYACSVTIAQEMDARIQREANHYRLQPIAPDRRTRRGRGKASRPIGGSFRDSQ
ncbi:Unknown protein, partial [Striga hermonthica]